MAESMAVAAEDQAFDSGFTPYAPPVVTPKDEPVVEPTKVELPVAAQAPPVAEPAPEYVQVTRDQLGRFMAAADETVAMRGKLDKALGTFGNVQQIVKQLQAVTPAGVPVAVDLSDDDFAELAADFPELAKHTRASFEKVLKKLNVRGTGEATMAAAAPDPAAVQKMVKDEVAHRADEALQEAYPDWREIVGAHSDAGNEFRQWLAKQPPKYAKRVCETYSPYVIEQAIDRFQETKAKPAIPPPAAKDMARQDRLRSAIPPKGDGGAPASSNPAVDPFDEGFRG